MNRDYLERTIATVRNHREADNCWPQWANIFADEIERLWQVEDAAELIRTYNDAGGNEWWEAHAKLYRALGADPRG